MMTSTAQQALRSEARHLIGTHYLTGAAGGRPGTGGGAEYRPGFVDLAPTSFDRRKPCIHTASSQTAFGHSICGGRWVACSGRPASSQEELEKYLAQEEDRFKKAGQVNCYFETYTPRLEKLKDKEHHVVWGEDCRNVRHFDCVGLVNYLLSKVCNLAGSYKQKGFSGDIHWHHDSTSPIPLDAPPVGGDILIPVHFVAAKEPDAPGAPSPTAKKPKFVAAANEGHIALLLDNGQVIQAKDPANGVVIGPYHASSWFYRGRHGDGGFLDFSDGGKQTERPLLSQG